MKSTILTWLGLILYFSLAAGTSPRNDAPKRLNIFVISKERHKKIDLTTEYVKLRAGISAVHAPDKFILIIAGSSKEAAEKIERRLHRKKRMIANLWFDSHGHYGDRMASFSVGNNKFYYKNIYDSATTQDLYRIAKFCDKHTKIGLGACYAGADYDFPATGSSAAIKMNGDSLLRGLGKIFNSSTIYASQSWVMAKPGMFTRKYGFAGYPIQKKFLDEVYQPVWERLGMWTAYSPITQNLEYIPTVSINRWGDIKVLEQNYNYTKKARNIISRKTNKLKPGLVYVK